MRALKKLQADIKTRLKKLREELQESKKHGRRSASYRVPREGAGQVVLVGPPNVGKSRLLAALTGANPEVAPYPFTTQFPQPGMMPWQNIAIQLVDLPPVTETHLESYVPGLIHAADAALLVADLSSDYLLDDLEGTLRRLERARIVLVTDRTAAGKADGELGPEAGLTPVCVKKAFPVANKLDTEGAATRLELLQEAYAPRFEILPVSAEQGLGLPELRERIYRLLNIIRVYPKPPGKPVDRQQPFTLPAGSTVLELARLIHRDFANRLRLARVWGERVYPGQPVGRDYVLHEGDIVELHLD
jgi:ribosome-interacting GTPase 1